MTANANGAIVQIIGAVIDVEFPRQSMPQVYDALVVEDRNLTLEVQQQLGDGVVRTIAMGSSEGLSRGLPVSNTGGPITVPVGHKTLGRIMDVLGDPVDGKGDIGEEDRWPIHRPPPASRTRPAAPNCWKPASRSSTCFARSPRAARSACSAAPAWARP